MAITIDSAFIEEYRNLVLHTVQQRSSLIRSFVTEVSSGGEAYNFERLGPTVMAEKTGRRVDTPYTDDVWDRRVAVPKTYNNAMTVEHEDKVQMLVDPMSNYHQAQGMAVARQWDDIIVAAATGTALDGDSTANAFPASQKIGDGSATLSYTLLTQVQELFMENHINPDVPKVMVVAPAQVRQLLAEDKAISGDYISQQYLRELSATGIVPNWMGFTWVVSNRLLAPATDETSCLAFTKSAIGLAVNQDLLVRISENPSKSYMWQAYVQLTAGAVRVEDEQIVHIHVADD